MINRSLSHVHGLLDSSKLNLTVIHHHLINLSDVFSSMVTTFNYSKRRCTPKLVWPRFNSHNRLLNRHCECKMAAILLGSYCHFHIEVETFTQPTYLFCLEICRRDSTKCMYCLRSWTEKLM